LEEEKIQSLGLELADYAYKVIDTGDKYIFPVLWEFQ